MNQSIRIPVLDLSQVGEARRTAAFFSSKKFPSEKQQGDLAIVISELATNLAKHGAGGEIVLTLHDQFIDALSIDRGPGISNVTESLQDGFSTSGTAGNGLGAIRRIASTFDLYTQSGKGTIIFARLFSDPTNLHFHFGGVAVAVEGERVSGDAWSIKSDPHSVTLILTDGLGHGDKAHEAATLATQCFDQTTLQELPQILQAVHGALRVTRGAAVSLLKVVYEKQVALFAGIGNVSGIAHSAGATRRMVSHSGIVGSQIRKIQEFSYPVNAPQNLLILHSDGINTHWDLKDYPGLTMKHPAIISAVIYRDHTRGRDDSSIVTLKWMLS